MTKKWEKVKVSEENWEEYKIIENWGKGEKIENMSGKLRIGVDLEECKMNENLSRDLESKERKLKIWVENWEKAEAARERRYADAHPRRTYVWSPGLFGLLIITLLRGNTYGTNTKIQRNTSLQIKNTE